MRPINADNLIEQIESPYTEHPIMIQIRHAIKEMIDSAPTIDAVPVVRCKACKWWKKNYSWSTGEFMVCVREAYEPLRNGEDFCSYGERRDEDETN